MIKSKQAIGIVGLVSVVLFLAAVIISIIGFEHGAYSPLSAFVSELGTYSGGYMTASVALVFNIGLIAAGLLLCAFMIGLGIEKNTPLFTAAAFFGVLSGVLIAAQGVFNLNFSQYHYIVTTAFFIGVFIFCTLFIITLPTERRSLKNCLPEIILAGISGICSAAFAGFMVTGGMAEIFVQDISGVGRLTLIPFAVVEWTAYILLYALIALLSVKMLMSRRTVSASTSIPMESKKQSNVDFLE